MNYCSNCGFKIDTDASKFCPQCGKNLLKNNTGWRKWALSIAIAFGLVIGIALLLSAGKTTAKKPIKASSAVISKKTPEQNNSIPFKEYTSNKYGITLKIPQHWIAEYKNNRLVVHGPLDTKEKMASIVIETFGVLPSRQLTLEGLGDALITQGRGYQDFRLIEDKKGKTTRKTLISFYNEKMSLMYHYEQVLIQHKNTIYAVSYVVPEILYEKYHQVMKAAVRSLKFL